LPNREFERLRRVDPETHSRWLSLQRALSEREGAAQSEGPQFGLRLALAIAAVVIVAVGGYIYLANQQRHSDRFATGRGEQKEVFLADSSQVILSYMTEAVVPKPRSGEPRRLTLTGEAYFRVRQNETPLIVSTAYAEVRVIGTEFNLRARGEALEVAVIRGRVKVSAIRAGMDSSLLLSQQQVALCPANGFPKPMGEIASPEYPGWMHGKLFLDKTPFQAACREVEMRFDITIRIDDQRLSTDLVTGILDARSAESALTALCGLTGKRFTHESQTYHIY